MEHFISIGTGGGTDGEMTSKPEAIVRSYYDAIDAEDYRALEDVLGPEFRQQRPDRTFDNRSEFIEFMRSGRPISDTSHEVETILGSGSTICAVGTVQSATGECLIHFVDVFQISNSRIVRLDTYIR